MRLHLPPTAALGHLCLRCRLHSLLLGLLLLLLGLQLLQALLLLLLQAKLRHLLRPQRVLLLLVHVETSWSSRKGG